VAPEGTIYVGANIKHNSPTKTGEFKYPGALVFTAAGAETGWTGGQSKASGGGKCTISFKASPSLAAGKEGDLFVLNAAAPDVVEFGPGGTGCPAARASVPSMTVKGQAVSGPVPAGSKVTLSSTVEQGNALSTAWNFGDGESETVSTDQFQTTKVTHTFTQPGEHTISETIHTDDLQTPEITVTGKLKVEGTEIKEAVKITTQPVAQSVEEGKTATFTAAASGIPAPAVQWQVSTNGGTTWANVPGATTTTLNTAPTTASENGYEYRAVFTNSSGSLATQAATLTVKAKGVTEAVKITAQPVAQIVEEGKTAAFTASASGIPAPSVQWQVSTDGGASWTNDTADAGNTTDTLSVANTTLSENGYEYRAVFTNPTGSKETEAAALTVKAKGAKGSALTITTQPKGLEVREGETATFTASASGAPKPTVQWQVSANGGATWANDTTDAGHSAGLLKVAGTTLSENGYEYRAVFTNPTGSKETEAAKLMVNEKAPEAVKAKTMLKETLLVPALPGGSGVLGEQTHALSPAPHAMPQSHSTSRPRRARCSSASRRASAKRSKRASRCKVGKAKSRRNTARGKGRRKR
jgi:hypothetical protein